MAEPPRTMRAWCWVALALVLAVPPAQAQVFGQNKVRYQRFDFRVLSTEHFDVHYYESERAAAERAARMAERWYERLSRVLDHTLSGRQPLILYASPTHFQQTNAVEGELGEGTGGVTEFFKRRIVLPLAATPAETDHVLGHELVHAFQQDITGGRSEASFSAPALSRLPLWFVEGMAEYLSLGAEDPHTAMWMRDAVAENDLPSWSRLHDLRYFPYRYGQAMWAYIAGRWGEERAGDLLRATRRVSLEHAVRQVLGVGPDTLVADWHQATRDFAAPVLSAARSTAPPGRTLVGARDGRGRINVSPALSPDGTRLAFLSERDLFSIELYLADARDGRILRRVTRTAVDPHLSSLQFLTSAGAWSADGGTFALTAVSEGRPVMTLLDGRSLDEHREIRLDVDDAFGPSWSPDGGRIAFSGTVGGQSDLFVLDLATGRTQRLTNDAFADLMPAWSLDGHTIAFVTDREGSRLATLEFGNERIALLDVATQAIRVIPGQQRGKHINPQWARDGDLLLVSDATGIPNVVRMDPATGAVEPVTDVVTGVSGITRLGPALAVARNADVAVASVYADGSYRLVSLDPRSETSSTVPAVATATLPPSSRRDEDFERLRESPDRAGVAAVQPRRRAYRPALSLDYVGQPSLGVAGGSGGFLISGGAGLFFSDMLGNHHLATVLSFHSAGARVVENITSIVAYENRKNRFDWGITAGQVPYFTAAFTRDEGLLDGTPAVRELEFRSWQIDRQVLGTVRYPFSRVFRIEGALGYRRFSFLEEVETRIFDAQTGELLEESIEDVTGDSLPELSFATTASALVYDNSVFGGTSPVMGQRWRLEAAPSFGDLRYVGVLADLRRYELPVRSVSLAGRILHFGRYGPGAERSILQPLYAGYASLVRGYDPLSFSAAECPVGVECAVDRLLGSRIGVANAEVRLMLFGPLGWIPSSGFLPVELAGFVDAGVAWNDGDPLRIVGPASDVLTSHGAALRFNMLGFAVGQLALVHPNDRPGKGWLWQFSLTPGF